MTGVINKDHYLKRELYDLIQKDPTIFEFLQAAALDGLWYWDLEHQEEEWMSPEFWTTLGYSPLKMKHSPSAWQDIINPDDLKVAIDNFHKHCADPTHPYDQIVRYKHANGSTVWVRCRGIAIRDDSGNPIRMLGAHNDITQIMETQASLDRVESRAESLENQMDFLQEIVEASPIGNILTNSEGTIVLLNREIERLFQFGRQELVGQKIEMLVPERFAEAHISMRDSYLEKPTRRPMGANRDLVGKRKDGSEFPVEIALSPVRTKQGTFVLASIVDVTERLQMRRQTEEYVRELQDSNDALEQFAYVASHDLNEPLRKIIAFGELLQKEYGDAVGEEGQSYIEYMRDGALRMRRLIKNLLSLARLTIDPPPPKKVNLKKVVNEVLDSLAPAIEESKATIEGVDSLPSLQAIPTHMHQLFQNLISNAIKFHRPEVSPALHFSAEETTLANGEEAWRIELRDNGIGFKSKDRTRLFELFRRIGRKTEAGGTGVGLAICMKIVRYHGGTISAESEPGKGSTFTLVLPKKPSETSWSRETSTANAK